MIATHVPVGPPGHWLAGHLPDFRTDRLGFLTRCAREYGDMVPLRFAHRRILLVNHPDQIEEILVTHSKHFIKHFALRLNPVILGKGLLTSEGDFWLRQRRLIQPVFVRTRIQSYAGDMVALTEKMLAAWKPGEACDIHEEMMRLTLAIAAKTLFNAEVGGDAHTIAGAMAVMQDNFLERFNSILPLPLWIPTPANLRARRAVRQLDDVMYRIIRARREAKSDEGDLLSLLLHARDEDDGSRMTDKQLRDEAMTLFLAGHETTALTLSWTWYLLGQHPEAERELWAELDGVLAGRQPNVDDWPKLKYTEMVALEAMRLYPPAYVIGREAITDCVIGGCAVPRGMTVLLPQWVVQRDPRFFDEPETFRPGRWGEERMKSMPRFAYFPFGGGPRVCIGQQFAMMELVLILATIARKYRFRLRPGVTVTPHASFTLRPSPGVPGVIEARSP
ncbi:MAG: cytochrome P450 [Planctomycetes bacterium]|nr:cytochrome P450 [Planctomycetota bacterium]